MDVATFKSDFIAESDKSNSTLILFSLWVYDSGR